MGVTSNFIQPKYLFREYKQKLLLLSKEDFLYKITFYPNFSTLFFISIRSFFSNFCFFLYITIDSINIDNCSKTLLFKKFKGLLYIYHPEFVKTF